MRGICFADTLKWGKDNDSLNLLSKTNRNYLSEKKVYKSRTMSAKYVSILPCFLIIICLQSSIVFPARLYPETSFTDHKSRNYMNFKPYENNQTAALTGSLHVIGGNDGPARVSRYVVMFVTVFTRRRQTLCSGSMVKNTVVLSAATFFMSTIPGVRIEKVLVFSIQKNIPQKRLATKVHIHEKFNPNTGLFNIAFVTINEPFNNPHTANIVIIPSGEEVAQPFLAAYGLLSLKNQQIPRKVQLIRLKRESEYL